MNEVMLYTVGYGNRQPERFFALLPGECTLVDVRVSPKSWHYEYHKTALRRRLGRRYIWWQALGNRSGDRDRWEPALGRTQAEEYLTALQALVEGSALNAPVVLMCAEVDPMRCHRRMIAEEIARRVPGLEIVHL